MLFITEYYPPKLETVKIILYDDSQLEEAYDERFKIELYCFRNNIKHEVGLFQAENEESFKASHSRYFSKILEIENRIKKIY